MKYSVVFLGTSEFAVPALSALLQDNRFNVNAVFTQPDRKVGRKQEIEMSAVKKRALEAQIPVHQPENINGAEWIDLMRSLEPDYLVVVSFGQILSRDLLTIPKIAPVNIHASLLPKYRGASPIQTALLRGDQETGVSIQQMVYELDAGAILAQRKCKIENDDTFLSLQSRLSGLSAPLLLATLSEPLQPSAQDDSQVSFCHKIEKEDGRINWAEESAEQIEHKLRAFTPWPGIYTFFRGKRLKILSLEVASTIPEMNAEPGLVTPEGIMGKNGFIKPKKVQLEGKKEVDIVEFTKGYGDFIGSVLL